MSVRQSTRLLLFGLQKWRCLLRIFLKSKRKKKIFLMDKGTKIPVLLCILVFGAFMSYLQPSKSQRKNSFEVDEAQLSINPTDTPPFLYPPISKTRPQYQFRSPVKSGRNAALSDSRYMTAALFSVFTFSKRPSTKLLDTAHTILNQSLQKFQWVIFYSCPIQQDCSTILQKVEGLDDRIMTIKTSAKMDFEGRYKSVISLLKARPTNFFTFLQEGDMFELTALEKGAWLFSSNQDVSFATTYVRETSKDEVVWKNGFHNGVNPFDSGEEEASFWIMGTTNVLLKNKCIQFSGGLLHGDDSIRKCLQQSRDCGVTIPEVLRWTNLMAPEFKADTKKSSKVMEPKKLHRVQDLNHDEKRKMKCPLLNVSGFSMKDEVRLDIPFENDLYDNKGVLFILPWMDIGGADMANLNLLQEFSKRGYRVTVVCSLMQVHGGSRALESLFLRFSHDIFTIPNIIRLADAPRFLSYLIRSRKVELVFLSNSELGYSLLPYLSQTHKSVKIVDYVHNEESKWRQGGYPFMSSKAKGHLDLTFASSKSAIKFMRNHGKDREQAQLGHLGIRLRHLKPIDDEKKSLIRQRLGIPNKAILISFVGRTVRVKQPMVLLKAFVTIARALTLEHSGREGKICIHLLIAGGGDERNKLEIESRRHPDIITFRPRVDHKEAVELIGASDIFCLPSLSEGISFATAEAMALGVATVTSDIGGFPELVGQNGDGGLMFTPRGNEEDDVLELMLCIEKIVRNHEWRKALQRRAEKRVRRIFDASVAIPDLVTRIIRTRLVRKTERIPKLQKKLKRELFHYHRVNGPVTDFTHIQKALLIMKRSGYGEKYQKTCGEYGEATTKIIDALESGSSCEGYTLNLEALRRSALSQCGQTRIANLEDRSHTMGWMLVQKCNGFVPVVL